MIVIRELVWIPQLQALLQMLVQVPVAFLLLHYLIYTPEDALAAIFA